MGRGRRLLDELTRGLQVAGEGAFSVDAGLARDKLRRYRLAEPRRYILAFVRAARALGAEEVHVTWDLHNNVIVWFHCEPLEVVDLKTLEHALFTGDDRPRALARRELASGVYAALGMDTKEVLIESGRAWARLDWGERDAVESRDVRFGQTRIKVVHDFDLRRRAADEPPELSVLRASTGVGSFPLFINDERHQATEVDSVLAERRYEDRRFRILATMRNNAFAPHVQFICRGVLSGRVALADSVRGVRVRIECDELQLDVSQMNVVMDGLATEGLEIARQLARGLVQEQMGAGHDIPDQLRTDLWRIIMGRDLAALRVEAKDDPMLALMVDLPVWWTLDQIRHPTSTLFEWADAGVRVGLTNARVVEDRQGCERVLYIRKKSVREQMRSLFPEAVDLIGVRVARTRAGGGGVDASAASREVTSEEQPTQPPLGVSSGGVLDRLRRLLALAPGIAGSDLLALEAPDALMVGRGGPLWKAGEFVALNPDHPLYREAEKGADPVIDAFLALSTASGLAQTRGALGKDWQDQLTTRLTRRLLGEEAAED